MNDDRELTPYEKWAYHYENKDNTNYKPEQNLSIPNPPPIPAYSTKKLNDSTHNPLYNNKLPQPSPLNTPRRRSRSSFNRNSQSFDLYETYNNSSKVEFSENPLHNINS
jgi:hypothetical protein